MRMSVEEYQKFIEKQKNDENKYHAVKTEVDGKLFDSKKEAKRFMELKLLERAGKIRDLKRQTNHEIIVKGMVICVFRSDFDYWEIQEKEKYVVEDTKGVKTPMYKLKKKLMKAVNNIDILET